MDRFAEDVVDRALAGEKLADEELEPLFALDPLGAEAAHVIWAAEYLTRRASVNCGQVYVQIGVDMLPCPIDCAFCSLARRNASPSRLAADRESQIVPVERIVEYARVFDDAGAHLISLMATAALPFEHYLGVLEAVRSAVSDDQVLMANAGDMTFEQAERLKDVGVQLVYHANRLGEGEITGVEPTMRMKTIANIKETGLGFMTAVEPVCASTPVSLVLGKMREIAALRPYCSGVGCLHAVPHTAMADVAPLSRPAARLYAAIMRLLVGESVPFGAGGGNVLWVDAGTNPRGRDLSRDLDFLKRDVARQRSVLEGKGWDVPKRPIYR